MVFKKSIRSNTVLALAATALLAALPSNAQNLKTLNEIYDEIPDSVYALEGMLPGGYTVDEVLNRVPEWPNPLVSFLPAEADPDMNYWRSRGMIEGTMRIERDLGFDRFTVNVAESEPNDDTTTANSVPGFGTGAGEDPVADITGTIGGGGDQDFFVIELEVGDIVGLGVDGAGRSVTLFDPSGTERVGTSSNLANTVYPPSTQLPTVGSALSAYVAEVAGTWFVSVAGGNGAYTLQVRLFTNDRCQKVFLDFDGPTVDPSVWGGPPGNVAVSPLADFLTNWGLNAGDENALIDAITASVTESLRQDLIDNGNNPNFDIQILNSRDNPGSFGDPNVSRVVVGGTIAETGISTIGIAQSIDPGNFEPEDDAIVLLDLLSAAAGNPNSLNQFGVDASATKLDLVAVGVGNITAHEAGHYLGNYHTQQFNATPNIQDQGGNLANSVGVGADGIFGTADDADVDFGPDQYVPSEIFTGTEDTLNSMALVMSGDTSIFEDGFETGDLTGWGSSFP